MKQFIVINAETAVSVGLGVEGCYCWALTVPLHSCLGWSPGGAFLTDREWGTGWFLWTHKENLLPNLLPVLQSGCLSAEGEGGGMDPSLLFQPQSF